MTQDNRGATSAEVLLAAHTVLVERVARGDDLATVLTDLARAVEGVGCAAECAIEVALPDHAEREPLLVSSRPAYDDALPSRGVTRQVPLESPEGDRLGTARLTWPADVHPGGRESDLLAWTARVAAAAALLADEHERLGASVALLEATLESTEDGILVVGDNGTIADHNQKFADMWRIDPELLSSGDDATVMESVLEQLVDPGGFVEEVVRLYSSPTEVSFDELSFTDGRIFERYSQPQLLDGRPVGRVWSFRDVTERRVLLKQLQESEDNLRRLVGQVRDYAFINLDPAGRVVSWNAGAQLIQGWTEDEILGSHVSVFYREEDAAAGAPQRMLDRAVAAGAAEDEGWRVRKDGEVYWADVVVSPLHDDEGDLRGFVQVTRDVSERRRADLALQQQTELLELLGSVATAANLADDIEEALAATLAAFCHHGDWQVGHAYVTDSAEPGRLMHSVWHEATPGEFAEFRAVTEELVASELILPARVLTSGQAVSIPAIALEADSGRTTTALAVGLKAACAFPVLVRNQPVAVLEFLSTQPHENDAPLLRVMGSIGAQLGRVVERDRAERALARRAAQLDSVLNSAADGIAGVDTRGTITFINEAGARLVGRRRDAILGRPAVEVLETAGLPTQDLGLGDRGLPPEGPRRVTGEHARADGSFLDLEIITAPILEDGQASGSVVVLRDISERRALDRMKDEFVSVISHELRTPLTSVHGALRLLAGGAGGALPAAAERMIALASSSTDRLVRLIDDLLDVERMAANKLAVEPDVVDAESLIVAAVGEMRGLAEAGSVTLAVGNSSGRVWADRDRIVQTLTNLIGNAVKFSPEGSTVRIDTVVRDDDVQFDVRDQGPGIPESELQTVFERFHQVDGSDTRGKGGTGLGLAICRGLVERHGGSIWATNGPDSGATFSFTLRTGPPAGIDGTPGALPRGGAQ